MKNIILLIAVLLTTSVNALTLTEAVQKFNGTELPHQVKWVLRQCLIQVYDLNLKMAGLMFY